MKDFCFLVLFSSSLKRSFILSNSRDDQIQHMPEFEKKGEILLHTSNSVSQKSGSKLPNFPLFSVNGHTLWLMLSHAPILQIVHVVFSGYFRWPTVFPKLSQHLNYKGKKKQQECTSRDHDSTGLQTLKCTKVFVSDHMHGKINNDTMNSFFTSKLPHFSVHKPVLSWSVNAHSPCCFCFLSVLTNFMENRYVILWSISFTSYDFFCFHKLVGEGETQFGRSLHTSWWMVWCKNCVEPP